LRAAGRCDLQGRIVVPVIEIVQELVSFKVHIIDHGHAESQCTVERAGSGAIDNTTGTVASSVPFCISQVGEL
jgi:hypothetical protein